MKKLPPSLKISSVTLKKLHSLAVKSRKKAYAPYSKFQVGSALLLKGGQIVVGCNVENVSFGGTICAERGAIMAAVAGKGKIKIEAVMVVTNKNVTPCGLCLQMLSEFSDAHCMVVTGTPQKILSFYTLSDLYPYAFKKFR